jgi:hypothetical protein
LYYVKYVDAGWSTKGRAVGSLASDVESCPAATTWRLTNAVAPVTSRPGLLDNSRLKLVNGEITRA